MGRSAYRRRVEARNRSSRRTLPKRPSFGLRGHTGSLVVRIKLGSSGKTGPDTYRAGARPGANTEVYDDTGPLDRGGATGHQRAVPAAEHHALQLRGQPGRAGSYTLKADVTTDWRQTGTESGSASRSYWLTHRGHKDGPRALIGAAPPHRGREAPHTGDGGLGCTCDSCDTPSPAACAAHHRFSWPRSRAGRTGRGRRPGKGGRRAGPSVCRTRRSRRSRRNRTADTNGRTGRARGRQCHGRQEDGRRRGGAQGHGP